MAHTRRFNFRTEADSVLSLDPNTIPNLSPKASIDLFVEGDSNPYFKIQAIKYPAKANGWDYIESFWQSYLSKVERAPVPGSRTGHNMQCGARGPTDLVVIGGKIESNGDGTGTVFLKNYIPLAGESGDNSVFIKANKAGMVDYSIVSVTRDLITPNADGSLVRQCVESLAGERNDCVDFGTGAMDMKTNSEEMVDESVIEEIHSLIKSGKVDKNSKWNSSGKDMEFLPGYAYGKAGLVFYSALRSTSNRAKNNGNLKLAQIADDLVREIDLIKPIKEKRMNKEELLATLATMKANGDITLAECAKAMGLESQLKSNTDVENLAKMNSIVEVLGEDNVVAKITTLTTTAKANAEAAREKSIIDLVGLKVNEDGTENKRYTYVQKITSGLEGEKFNSALAGLKDDSIFKHLAEQAADVDSDANITGTTRKVNAEDYSAATVVL